MKTTHFFYTFIFLSIGLWINPVFGQTNAHYHYFQDNWLAINPAMFDQSVIMGYSKDNPLVVQGRVRTQWGGIEGAPKNYHIAFEATPDFGSSITNVKWGGQAIGETIGNFKRFGAFANFAYVPTLNATKDMRISIGTNFGFSSVSFNNLEATVDFKDVDDVILDAVLGETITYLDASFGVFFHVGT